MGRFLTIWLAALLGLLGAVFAFNVAVDPYGILDMPRIPGFNAEKVAGADWPRLSKPYLVEIVDPTTIVLGSSNTDVGINPDSAAWPAALRPVFNLSIDGSTPATLYHYLQHALVLSHPKLVLIGVSFEDALVFPATGRLSAATQAQFSYESRLRVGMDGKPNPEYFLGRLKDMVFATLSLTALRDSVSTLLRQNDPGDTFQSRAGWNSGGRFSRWARTEGAYSLVSDKNRTKAPELLRWSFQPALSVAPIGDIVRLVQAHGAKPIVFILPNYVDELEIHRQLGITPLVSGWKADIVATVERAARPGEPVPVWDFSGFSRYTTEALPGPGDTSRQLEWMWEPIHFKSALGDLMLQRMLTDGGPGDLGVRLTSADLAQNDAVFAARQAEWVASHKQDVARINALIEGAARSLCHTDLAGCPRSDPRITASR